MNSLFELRDVLRCPPTGNCQMPWPDRSRLDCRPASKDSIPFFGSNRPMKSKRSSPRLLIRSRSAGTSTPFGIIAIRNFREARRSLAGFVFRGNVHRQICDDPLCDTTTNPKSSLRRYEKSLSSAEERRAGTRSSGFRNERVRKRVGNVGKL